MEIVMPKNTQRLQIISHLKNKGSITTAAAFTLYGITRLAVYICMLRKDGYDIQDEWITNSIGTRWKEYTLNKIMTYTFYPYILCIHLNRYIYTSHKLIHAP